MPTAPTPQHQSASDRLTMLLADSGLPAPDIIEYETDSIRFLWHDKKVCVVIDLTADAT